MSKLKPCPFCGRELLHISGKPVNQYYDNEPTLYQHPQYNDCILGRYGREVQVWARNIEAWNRRVKDETD